MVSAGWGLSSAWDELSRETPVLLRAVSDSYEIFAYDMVRLMLSAFEQKPQTQCQF